MMEVLNIAPGSKVLVSYCGGKVIIENPRGSSAAILARIAAEGPSLVDFDSHAAEEENEERTKRCST
jgi:hypothetical protein